MRMKESYEEKKKLLRQTLQWRDEGYLLERLDVCTARVAREHVDALQEMLVLTRRISKWLKMRRKMLYRKIREH